ncbi:hypothetical protein MKX67_18430 [Cytobacillus sp. FSL W7-1323]|uniref:hypothetical protein n=2 Tax=Cytobacillus TaxID=2675230 RepID=UPI0031594A08
MEQVYLKQLIEHLESQLDEHGDLPVCYCDDALIGKETGLPIPSKIYSYKSYDLLNSDSLDVLDENLYDVDLEKPIIKAIIV